MPTFSYQSLTHSGQSRSGVLPALDRGHATRQLLGRGETATAIELADGQLKLAAPRTTAKPQAKPGQSAAGFSLPGLARLTRGRPSLGRAEMANLVRELATAIEAARPVMRALKTGPKQASGKAFPVILDHLIERVEAGEPLHSAARDYGP